jgi:lysophospholipase L1-like esterase
MKKGNYFFHFLALIAIIFLSFKNPGKVRIWMIGDSTMANKKAEVAPETGWGMVLQDFFNNKVKVHNHAVNGRSSRSFMSEGSLNNYGAHQVASLFIDGIKELKLPVIRFLK